MEQTNNIVMHDIKIISIPWKHWCRQWGQGGATAPWNFIHDTSNVF